MSSLTRRHWSRRGFTIIEIVIALTIFSIVGLVLTKILLSQTQSFQRDVSSRRSRSGSRSAVNVMISDLRMTQDVGGVQVANDSTVTVRVPVIFGLVCASAGATSLTIATVAVDSFVTSQVKYGGYAVRSSTSPYTYSYVPSLAGSATPTGKAACSGLATPVRPDTVSVRPNVALQGSDTGRVVLFTPGTTAATYVGQPAFLWQTVSYMFRADTVFTGTRALYRQTCNGATTPLCASEKIMAPFTTKARFNYYLNSYLNSNAPANQDSAVKILSTGLADVRGVEIVLAAQSPDTARGSRRAARSTTTTSVFFKNVRMP
jgi:prepilin-type N-terminal cleavage/methylation domain-containing protein